MFTFSLRPQIVSVAAVVTVLLYAVPALACEPASAINRYRRECKTGDFICFAGPCKRKLGELDSLGRFAIVKPNQNFEVDYITWTATNVTKGGVESVSVAESPTICGPVPSGVSECEPRFKIPNVKACPLNSPTPCPGQKETATLTSLEQVNQATTPNGQVHLSDGQIIKGKGRKRFWLHYEVCCPDDGEFGRPGDFLETAIDYTMRNQNIVTSCVQKSTRSVDPREIPDRTDPCGGS